MKGQIMRAHLLPLASFKYLTRLTICLALLAAFSQVGLSAPASSASPTTLRAPASREAPVQWSTHASMPEQAGMPDQAWQTIQGIIQADQAQAARRAWLSQPLTSPVSPRGLAADTWLRAAQILPDDPQAGLAFGYSVAIDDDLVVVGAYWDHGVEYGEGAAYLFRKPDSGWAEIYKLAKLKASDAGFHDSLGWSVDIYGNDIVAGAPGDDTNQGSAYLFAQPLGGWRDTTETAKLTVSDRAYSDQFGSRVVFSSYDTIIVSAPFDDIGVETDQGSVYIFARAGAAWYDMTESARFYTTDGSAYDYCGGSLAADEETIVVGAHAHHSGDDIGAGQAYVYLHANGWNNRNEDARLVASDSAEHEYFGWSVGVDGDVIVVGAPGEVSFDNTGEEAAYVFVRPAGDWIGELTEDALLTASDGAFEHEFGNRVAISGDTIVVGAPDADTPGGDVLGAVYAFTRPTGGWASMTETDKLYESDLAIGYKYSYGLAIQDGVIVVGAPEYDLLEYVNNGAVYVYVPQAAPSEFLYLPSVLRP